jgi:hypothetical protein
VEALSIIAGETNQLTVVGVTACLLCKTELDKEILYVSMTSGLVKLINWGVGEPGKVAIPFECK